MLDDLICEKVDSQRHPSHELQEDSQDTQRWKEHTILCDGGQVQKPQHEVNAEYQ